MPAPRKKRPRRTSDGRPEMRTPDQILREASDSITRDLPSKGKKLDLDAYFRSGEEHRIANKILKDNGVLPLHLQDRKDAEDLRNAGEAEIEQQRVRLEEIGGEIGELVTALRARLDLPAFLVDRHPNPPREDRDRRSPHEMLEALERLVTAHDQRRANVLIRYREALESANAATERYNRHIAATGRLLPPYPAEALIDVDRRVDEAEATLPPAYEPDPADLDRLKVLGRDSRSLVARIRFLWRRGTPP